MQLIHLMCEVRCRFPESPAVGKHRIFIKSLRHFYVIGQMTNLSIKAGCKIPIQCLRMVTQIQILRLYMIRNLILLFPVYRLIRITELNNHRISVALKRAGSVTGYFTDRKIIALLFQLSIHRPLHIIGGWDITKKSMLCFCKIQHIGFCNVNTTILMYLHRHMQIINNESLLRIHRYKRCRKQQTADRNPSFNFFHCCFPHKNMLLHVFPSAPLCRFSAHSYASAFSCCTYYAAGYRLIFQRIKRNSCAIPLKLYLYVFTLGSILDFIQRLLRLMEHAGKQIAWEHFHKIVEFHTYCIIVFT